MKREDLALQRLSKAEEIVQSYAQKVLDEKTKLLHTRSNHKNISLFDKSIQTIDNCEINIEKRASYFFLSIF